MSIKRNHWELQMLILGWYSGLNEANLKQNRCRTQIAARKTPLGIQPWSPQSATPDFCSRSHDAVIRVYDESGNVLYPVGVI
jgi:hypothetical protein